MSIFAQIENNIVTQVIVADQEFIDSGAVWDNWIETYPENYAWVGYSYDKELGIFIPPKQFEWWVLNKEKIEWEAPIPIPDNKNKYNWDEKSKEWVIINK